MEAEGKQNTLPGLPYIHARTAQDIDNNNTTRLATGALMIS
jgi:hypothetical protein